MILTHEHRYSNSSECSRKDLGRLKRFLKWAKQLGYKFRYYFMWQHVSSVAQRIFQTTLLVGQFPPPQFFNPVVRVLGRDEAESSEERVEKNGQIPLYTFYYYYYISRTIDTYVSDNPGGSTAGPSSSATEKKFSLLVLCTTVLFNLVIRVKS